MCQVKSVLAFFNGVIQVDDGLFVCVVSLQLVIEPPCAGVEEVVMDVYSGEVVYCHSWQNVSWKDGVEVDEAL